MTDIIIISYNGLNALKKCLSSVRHYTDFRRCNVTVVDNGSTDGTQEYLKKYNGFDHMLLNSNRGFPKAFNLCAKRGNGDFVISLNDDIEVTEGWLKKLHEEMKSDVGIVGVKAIYPDGRIYCADQLAETIGDIGRREKDMGQRDYIKECDAVWGGCLLIQRELFKKVGYFDERLFIYEDIDFCLRVRTAGYKVIYNGTVTIMHHDSQRPKLKAYQSLKYLVKKWDNFSSFPLKDTNPIDKSNSNGLKYLKKKWYRRAIKEFKKAARFGGVFAMHKFMGYAYHNLGRYHEALLQYEKALKQNQEDCQAYRLMGVTFEALGRYKEAELHFKKAIKIYPSYSDGYNSLGTYYLNRSNPAKAVTFLKKAIELEKSHLYAHYNLGLAFEMLERHKEAKRSYKNALRINPKDRQAKKNLEKLTR